MVVQVQLCSEDLDKEVSLQVMVELLYCICKTVLCPFHKVKKINSKVKKHIIIFIKTLYCHLNRLSFMHISPHMRKPMRPLHKITIVCRDHNGIETLGATMFELSPKELITLHPRLMIEFLEMFVEESSKCLQRKWASVPTLCNLPTMCNIQVKNLSRELYQQLRTIKYNHDKEYYPIVSVILTLGSLHFKYVID